MNLRTRIALRLAVAADRTARRAVIPNPHATMRVVVQLLADPDIRDYRLADAIGDELGESGFWPGHPPYHLVFPTRLAPVARALLAVSDKASRWAGKPSDEDAVRHLVALYQESMSSGDLIDAMQFDLTARGYTWPDPDEQQRCDGCRQVFPIDQVDGEDLLCAPCLAFAESQRAAAVAAFAPIAHLAVARLGQPWTVTATDTGADFTYEHGITMSAAVTAGRGGEPVVELDVALNGTAGQDPITVRLPFGLPESTRVFRLVAELTALRDEAETWEPDDAHA